jgi:Spy/CpxP family protein refolding chaperone
MHFIGPVVLGIFLGMAAARAMRWRRFGHHFHGGCGRFRHGAPFWMGGFGIRRAFWFVRDLDLSPEQVSRLKQAWLLARGAIASVKATRLEVAHGVMAAALAEPFDRARLDDAARKLADENSRAAHDVADALAQAIEVLTPEQRAKLRERFARHGIGFGGPVGPDAGPYRSSGYYV